MNVQLAWQDDQIYVIEVNPRASRTVPFVSKAMAYHWPRSLHVAWRDSHPSQGFTAEVVPNYYSVKEAVLLLINSRVLTPFLAQK